MIVLPGYGKAFDVRQLSILWYRIEWLSIRERGVSIIGLNISQDDFIVESLFRYLLRGGFSDATPIVVINPDSNVEERFRKIAGSYPFIFHNEKFSEETLNFALFT